MHAPAHPLCTPTQPIPASSQAELTSPEGIPVIAACVHVVDGSARHHNAPGKNSNAKMRWKADCATTVLRQLMELREQRRGEALAWRIASSRGQRIASALERWPGPRIIMMGDLNTTDAAIRDAMCQLRCRLVGVGGFSPQTMVAIADRKANRYEGLLVRGAAGIEGVCYDILLDSTAQSSDRDATRAEPGQVEAPKQSAGAADAATQAVAQGPEEPQSWQQEEAHWVNALREQLDQGPRRDKIESEQLLAALLGSKKERWEEEFTRPPAL